MAEDFENPNNIQGNGVVNENPVASDEEYEYEYIEVADGEELPEDAEYEYVEVVDEENAVNSGEFQEANLAPTVEVPEPILSVPPMPQQNASAPDLPSVEKTTEGQLPHENVQPLSQPVEEADLNALLDDDGEIQEVNASTLLDGDYSDDFARNLFESKTSEPVEEVSLDDILGEDAAATPAGFEEVKEVSPEELVASIKDSRDDGSLRQSIWADLTDDEAINTESDEEKVLYNEAGERQVITEETIIMSQNDEEPVVEATPEPVVETAPEPVVEATPEPVVETAPEPVVEAIPEPVVETAPEPVVEAAPEPVVETVPEPVVEVAPEPIVETVPEPVEAAPEPVVEAVPEPVVEVAPEPVVEATPEPVVEAAPEPVVEAAPEPVVEAVPEPVVEAAPEPVVEAAPEPVVEAAPEPVVETIQEQMVDANIVSEVDAIEADVYVGADSEPYVAAQAEVIGATETKIPEKVTNNLLSEDTKESILGRVVQLAYQSVALTEEQHAEMLAKEHIADKNSGMQFFNLQGGSLLLNADDVHELSDWHLIIFNQNLVPVQSDEKIEIIQPSDTIRMATVVKRGSEKLNIYNEEVYQFQNPEGEFLPAQKHFIYGQTDDDTGLIVNDFVNVDLSSHAGKVLNFENSVFGWLSGPEGAQIYFAQLGKLAVFAPEKKDEYADADALHKHALKWLSGNENDKYFEFSGASQSAEFVGNEEIKNIHINVGTSAYGWNVSFDNGVAMSLRDLQEFESKHGKLPSANGEVSHGNVKLKFSNVEKIVVYQTPQYFGYGRK